MSTERPTGKAAEAARLEELWAGSFGAAYTERNAPVDQAAGVHHAALFRGLGVRSVLEVGCNAGLNLTRMATDAAFEIAGVDLCQQALAQGCARLPGAKLARATVYDLPFAGQSFDLVFTCGVLIHVPPSGLVRALREIHRTTRRFIWCGEYFSAVDDVIPYRGEARALFKRDYGAHYLALFPDLRLRDRGFWGKPETGFDDLTWWMFEKP